MPTERTLRIAGAVWFGVCAILILAIPRIWWIDESLTSRAAMWLWFETKLWMAPALMLVLAGSLPVTGVAAATWAAIALANNPWQTSDWLHLLVPAMLVAAAAWGPDIRQHRRKEEEEEEEEVIVPNQRPPVERQPSPVASPLDHG